MTTDELVSLLDGLIGNLTLTDLRHGLSGIEGPLVAELSDEGYALLVRFVSGERLSEPSRPSRYLPSDSPVAIPPERAAAFEDDEDPQGEPFNPHGSQKLGEIRLT